MVPPAAKTQGRPAITARLSVEAGSSTRQPSMLNPQLEVAPGIQIELNPEFEGVLTVVPTNNLVA